MRLRSFALLVALGGSAFAAPPVLPRQAKELEIDEPGGKHDLLTSYKRKVVIIQFLSTTCPHCQAYSQLLTKLQNEYGPKGFQALGGAFNEEANPATVSNYIKQFQVGFPVGPVARDTVYSFMGFGADERIVVPQVVLIDRKGQIREQTEGTPTGTGPAPLRDEAHLHSAIEKLLGETGAGKAAPTTGSSNKAAPKKPTS